MPNGMTVPPIGSRENTRGLLSGTPALTPKTWGAVYLPNLKTALLGTPWQYCPIGQFYRQINEPIQASTFLAACLEHPVIEHLVKVGFTKLAGQRCL